MALKWHEFVALDPHGESWSDEEYFNKTSTRSYHTYRSDEKQAGAGTYQRTRYTTASASSRVGRTTQTEYINNIRSTELYSYQTYRTYHAQTVSHGDIVTGGLTVSETLNSFRTTRKGIGGVSTSTSRSESTYRIDHTGGVTTSSSSDNGLTTAAPITSSSFLTTENNTSGAYIYNSSTTASTGMRWNCSGEIVDDLYWNFGPQTFYNTEYVTTTGSDGVGTTSSSVAIATRTIPTTATSSTPALTTVTTTSSFNDAQVVATVWQAQGAEYLRFLKSEATEGSSFSNPDDSYTTVKSGTRYPAQSPKGSNPGGMQIQTSYEHLTTYQTWTYNQVNFNFYLAWDGTAETLQSRSRIEEDGQSAQAVNSYNHQAEFDGYTTVVSISYPDWWSSIDGAGSTRFSSSEVPRLTSRLTGTAYQYTYTHANLNGDSTATTVDRLTKRTGALTVNSDYTTTGITRTFATTAEAFGTIYSPSTSTSNAGGWVGPDGILFPFMFDPTSWVSHKYVDQTTSASLHGSSHGYLLTSAQPWTSYGQYYPYVATHSRSSRFIGETNSLAGASTSYTTYESLYTSGTFTTCTKTATRTGKNDTSQSFSQVAVDVYFTSEDSSRNNYIRSLRRTSSSYGYPTSNLHATRGTTVAFPVYQETGINGKIGPDGGALYTALSDSNFSGPLMGADFGLHQVPYPYNTSNQINDVAYLSPHCPPKSAGGTFDCYDACATPLSPFNNSRHIGIPAWALASCTTFWYVASHSSTSWDAGITGIATGLISYTTLASPDLDFGTAASSSDFVSAAEQKTLYKFGQSSAQSSSTYTTETAPGDTVTRTEEGTENIFSRQEIVTTGLQITGTTATALYTTGNCCTHTRSFTSYYGSDFSTSTGAISTLSTQILDTNASVEDTYKNQRFNTTHNTKKIPWSAPTHWTHVLHPPTTTVNAPFTIGGIQQDGSPRSAIMTAEVVRGGAAALKITEDDGSTTSTFTVPCTPLTTLQGTNVSMVALGISGNAVNTINYQTAPDVIELSPLEYAFQYTPAPDDEGGEGCPLTEWAAGECYNYEWVIGDHIKALDYYGVWWVYEVIDYDDYYTCYDPPYANKNYLALCTLADYESNGCSCP